MIKLVLLQLKINSRLYDLITKLVMITLLVKIPTLELSNSMTICQQNTLYTQNI